MKMKKWMSSLHVPKPLKGPAIGQAHIFTPDHAPGHFLVPQTKCSQLCPITDTTGPIGR